MGIPFFSSEIYYEFTLTFLIIFPTCIFSRSLFRFLVGFFFLFFSFCLYQCVQPLNLPTL